MAAKRIFRNVVGPSVQRHRAARGWSQAMLATKCQLVGWDVSRGIVAAIEGRVRWVGDWEAVLLAKIFSVPISELFPLSFKGVDFGLPRISTSYKSPFSDELLLKPADRAVAEEWGYAKCRK